MNIEEGYYFAKFRIFGGFWVRKPKYGSIKVKSGVVLGIFGLLCLPNFDDTECNTLPQRGEIPQNRPPPGVIAILAFLSEK